MVFDLPVEGFNLLSIMGAPEPEEEEEEEEEEEIEPE